VSQFTSSRDGNDQREKLSRGLVSEADSDNTQRVDQDVQCCYRTDVALIFNTQRSGNGRMEQLLQRRSSGGVRHVFDAARAQSQGVVRARQIVESARWSTVKIRRPRCVRSDVEHFGRERFQSRKIRVDDVREDRLTHASYLSRENSDARIVVGRVLIIHSRRCGRFDNSPLGRSKNGS